jgi:hypothetical protein
MPHGGVPRVQPTKQALMGRHAMKAAVLNRGAPIHINKTSFVGISESARAAPVW